ncbi:MAG TPA: 3,4-dihydroxy-2-butanone-4-phosphate synthase [Acidobacteriaceae bacterium]|jgi:3,4-dihydroxy 2-butanone 4-phosphate synthase/GTP cyclohydrolase II
MKNDRLTRVSRFVSAEEALKSFAAGRMVVVVDDEERENEGDITIAAEYCTAETINFMARHGRGLICLSLTEDHADRLRLAPMTHNNTSRMGTAFTESIEAREGITTGISAADRARTVQVAIAPETTAGDLARPGHMFPLRARNGGVLVRAGHTEASVDLARLAGLTPAAVICEILRDDGGMARVDDLEHFCDEHDLQMVTVAELIRFRLQTERNIERVSEAAVPTALGVFRMISYRSVVNGKESHMALVMGDESSFEELQEPILVRVHAHCVAGDIFGAISCGCRASLDFSMQAIAQAGRGAIVLLHHTQRSETQDSTPPQPSLHDPAQPRPRSPAAPDSPTLRQIGIGSQILADLGIRRIRLITKHRPHVPALQGFGIEIAGYQPIVPVIHSRADGRVPEAFSAQPETAFDHP